MSELQVKSAEITLQKYGAYGSKAITGTSAVTPPSGFYFFCIVPSSDTVVAAQVDLTGATNADLTAITSHPKGYPIYTKLTSITLTSGDGIGYLARI